MAPRKTAAAVAEPNDWQTVEPNDWQTVTPDTPKPSAPVPLHVTPDVAANIWKAGVHAQMLGVTPGVAYDQRETIDKTLREHGGNYDDGKLDDSISNDIKVGLEGSIFGLHHREKLPDEVRNPGIIDKFITGAAQTVADLPWMIAGGAAGGVVGGAAGSEIPVIGNAVGAKLGASAGAFALPAAMREVLVQGIKKGDVKGFGDLMHRAAAVTWEATKGAVTGAITEATAGIPVAGIVAKSGVATTAVKGLYQATAMTVTGDLLDGRVPNANDFSANAALIIPLNLITHGVAMRHGEAETAAQDVYVKNGTTPQQTSENLSAQPPVKADAPPGLRPAIEIQHGYGEGFIDADEGESHADLSDRVLSKKPVTMEQLEASPEKADGVLETPAIHEQEVIDRAWQIKKDAIDAGEVETPGEDGEAATRVTNISELYNRGDMKSGRGFVTPDGKFLSRMEAKRWMKENEPDAHELWEQEQGGNKQAELHSEDYVAARNRAQARSVAEGDPVVAGMSPQNVSRLAAAREGLNKIKAGMESKGYGREVLRTLFVGQRDTRIAETTQLRDSLKKIIPDYRDQEALSIFRDYKGDEDRLASDLEGIRAGDNERLKALIPSIERAINPTPEMLEADQRLTGYYAGMLEEGRQLGTLDSAIDPANYTPHILNGVVEEGESPSGVRRSAMTKNSQFAKGRKYATIIDALKTEKVDARAINALDALSIRGDSHAVSVATKLLETELKNTDLGKYGTEEDHPDGWTQIGKQRGVEQLYVPKDVSDALRPIVEPNVLRDQPGAKSLQAMQGFTKSLELGLSIFHMKALSITAMNNMSFADFTRSLASDTKSPEFAEAERGWAADGLRTSKTATPYEAYEGLKESSVKEAFEWRKPSTYPDVRKFPGVKQVDAVAKWLTDETFDVIQRKFKVQDAELKAASWRGKNPEASEEEYFAARRSIAKEVNSAYGGLNWEVMGFGKNARTLTQALMLAPDWTFSNIANVKYAVQGGPSGAAARMFWIKSFATGIALTQATSIAISGQLSDHPTQVYLGKDKDGKPLYSDWFFAGAPRDSINLVGRIQRDGAVAGPAEFIVSKLGPIGSSVLATAFNKDGIGRPIYKAKDSAAEKTGKDLEFLGGKAVPITVKTVAQMMMDGKSHTMMEYAAAAAGSNTTNGGEKQGKMSTPASSKTSRPGGSRKFSIRR